MTALVLLALCADPQLEPPPLVPAAPSAQPMPPPPPPPPSDSAYAPPPSEPRTKRLWPISVAGGATLLVTWVGSIIGQLGSISCHGGLLSSDINCSSESWWLWIPLIGPWFALTSSNTSDNGRPWVIMSGILQLSGLAGIIAGLIVRVPDTSVEVGPFKLRPSLNGFAAAFN